MRTIIITGTHLSSLGMGVTVTLGMVVTFVVVISVVTEVGVVVGVVVGEVGVVVGVECRSVVFADNGNIINAQNKRKKSD